MRSTTSGSTPTSHGLRSRRPMQRKSPASIATSANSSTCSPNSSSTTTRSSCSPVTTVPLSSRALRWASSSTKRATACAATSARFMKARCARLRSHAGLESFRPVASLTDRGRSGIFCRRPPSWPAPSSLQVTKLTGFRSSRFSKVARHRSAIISTGNSTRPTNRSKPSVSATGRPCAMAPDYRSNSTISRATSRKRKTSPLPGPTSLPAPRPS